MIQKITIATRGSQLALWQANFIAHSLQKHHPGLKTELKIIKTSGDKIQDVPLAQVGGKGLFVKEIEEALLRKEADLAVHSMKDVPAELPKGLTVDVTPKRADFTDSFLSNKFKHLSSLPAEATIGTSSLRRQAQLLAQNPTLQIKTLRGNLDTRLKKLDQFDAIIVASAGLDRLGDTLPPVRFKERLLPPHFLPAIGQGTLGVEYHKENTEIQNLLQPLHNERSWIMTQAERAFLLTLEGGCQVPLGALAEVKGDTITLTGFVASVDGKRFIQKSQMAPKEKAPWLGQKLAQDILDQGGKEILQEVYQKSAGR